MGIIWQLLAGNKWTFRNLQQFVNVPLMKIQLLSPNNQLTPGISSSLQGSPDRDPFQDLGPGTPRVGATWIKNPMGQGTTDVCFFINGYFYSLNPEVAGNGRL